VEKDTVLNVFVCDKWYITGIWNFSNYLCHKSTASAYALSVLVLDSCIKTFT